MDQTQTACTNCKQVVTQQLDASGQAIKVWVCESCGTENKLDETAAQAAVTQAAAASPVAPVMPTGPAPVTEPTQ